nr:DUF5777 family beta-barrel protein [Saprospiraceae bacterium]
QVFKDRRVINSQSTEMLKTGKLDFRVGHTFGDIAGEGGGWTTLYGLESAADILIGFDYGLHDNIMVGVNRTKGSGPLRQNLNGHLKLKLLTQKVNGLPISVAAFINGTYTTMQKGVIPGSLTYFEKTLHRFMYHSDVIISSKLSKGFSIQAIGGYTYRNLVDIDDINGLLSAGLAARIQVTKSIGLILDSRVIFSDLRKELKHFPLGAGLEWETGGGHVFQINVTNARGLAETDYIPYTNDDWSLGQFRIGFTIARQFSL